MHLLSIYLIISNVLATNEAPFIKFKPQKQANPQKINNKPLELGGKLRSREVFSKGNEFILGASLPQKFSLGQVGNALENGFNLAFAEVNKTGGILGKFKISFDSQDDQYDREKCKKNILYLAKKTLLMTGILGADQLIGLYPILKQDKCAILFPAVSCLNRYECLNKNIFYFRPTMSTEIQSLLNYAKQQGIKKISIFYEDSIFGAEGFAIAKKMLTDFEVELLNSASYPKNSVNIMKAVKEISKQQPNAILCISQAYPTYNFIQQLVNGGMTNTLFLGTGELFFIQPIINKDKGRMVISSVVPNPEKSDLEIVRQYRNAMSKERPLDDLSTFSLEGFICGKIIKKILELLPEKAKLSDLFEQIEQLNMPFDGIYLKFNPTTRTLSQKAWINVGDSSLDWDHFEMQERK